MALLYRWYLGIQSKKDPGHVMTEVYKAMQVRYSTVQYSILQYSTVQYSIVQYSKVQYSSVQYRNGYS